MALEVVKKEISLNVGQPNNFELICAMQGDNKSFEITATLYDVNKLYTINTDNIKLKGVNPLGSNLYKDVKGHTANTVTFALTEDMLAYDGLLKLVLVLAESSTQLTTFPFVIKVVNSPGNTNADDMQTVSALVEEAKKWAMLSKSYAVGTDNEVRKGDAKDNSKYYYEQIKELYDSGKIGNGKILYFETYEEFKKELDAGKVENETLICIKEGNGGEDSGGDSEDDEKVIAGTLTGDYLLIIHEGHSYFSKDDGMTWNILEENGLTEGYDFISHTKDNNNNYYTTSRSGHKRYIYKSSDSQVWKCIATIEQSDIYDLCAFIKYANDKLFIFGGHNYCFYSSDYGITWKQSGIPVNKSMREMPNGSGVSEYVIENIEYSPTIGRYVACGQFGHSYYSLDGDKWNQINGLKSDYRYNIASFNNKFIMFGVYCGVYALSDCENEYIVYTSSDGINWSLVYNFSSEYKAGLFDTPNCLVENGHCIFLSNNYIFHSDNGENWTVTKRGNSLCKIQYFHNKFIIPSKNYTYISTDGINWELYENNLDFYNNSILIAAQEGENA